MYGHDVEQNDDTERAVVLAMVQEWLDDGKTPEQIFLIWNQGDDGPCKAGTNSYGVHYDSCAYVDKALALLGS